MACTKRGAPRTERHAGNHRRHKHPTQQQTDQDSKSDTGKVGTHTQATRTGAGARKHTHDDDDDDDDDDNDDDGVICHVDAHGASAQRTTRQQDEWGLKCTKFRQDESEAGR